MISDFQIPTSRSSFMLICPRLNEVYSYDALFKSAMSLVFFVF